MKIILLFIFCHLYVSIFRHFSLLSIPLFFFKTTWQKWDLSVLGEVVSVALNIVGSADLYGDWGLNAPAYFAYDDIAVRFDKNDQTALFNSHTASFPNSCKVLHNGQLLIFRNGKTYSIMGQYYRSSKVPSE